jgi:hypothetical protein
VGEVAVPSVGGQRQSPEEVARSYIAEHGSFYDGDLDAGARRRRLWRLVAMVVVVVILVVATVLVVRHDRSVSAPPHHHGRLGVVLTPTGNTVATGK